MNTIKITTSQNIEIHYDVAGPGERILGYFIDMALFIILFLALGISIALADKRPSEIVLGFIIIGCFLIFGAYDLACEIFFNGQSLGKRIMKTRVISLSGTSPTIGQYLLRWLFRIVDFSLTSNVGALIAVAVTEKKQRIGDLVAGTTVIRTVPRETIDQVAFMPPEENYTPVYPEAAELKDKDIALIHEILENFKKSGNYTLLHQTGLRVKDALKIENKGQDDYTFLQTVIKDYNYYSSKI